MYIDDAIVLFKGNITDPVSLVAHITWNDNPDINEKASRINEINHLLSTYLPYDVVLLGYREYKNMLPYSPTTLKKDKNKMARNTDGIFQVVDGTLHYVE